MVVDGGEVVELLQAAYPGGSLVEVLGLPTYEVFYCDYSNADFVLEDEVVVAITFGASCAE